MITTIIPTYNRRNTLVEAIESVRGQTYRDWRVLVYDDGGSEETSRTVRALARRDERICYVRNSERLGATCNFRRGLAEVRSDYFSFLSDDDLLLPQFYERAMRAFHRFPDAHIAGGVTQVVNPAGQVISDSSEWIPAGWYPAPRGLQTMLRTRHREWTGVLFRREVRDSVGLIDRRTKVPDLDFMLRAAAVCNVILFDSPVAIFRSHAGSSTFHLTPEFIYPSYLFIAELLRQDARIPLSVRDWSSRELERRVDRYLIRRAVKDIAGQDAEKARMLIDLLRNARGCKTVAMLLDSLTTIARLVPIGGAIVRAIERTRRSRRWLRKTRARLEVFDALERL